MPTLSEIAHAEHPIHAPLSDTSVAALLARLALTPRGRVVDAGCATGEWLLRLVMRRDLDAVGIDIGEGVLDAAPRRATQRGVAASTLQFVRADARTWQPGVHVDAVLCVGSTHAFGGLRPALSIVHRWLRPQGRLLVGEGFWERPPSVEALLGLNAGADEFSDLATTLDACRNAGYRVIHHVVSSTAEWDAYEASWTRSVERWCGARPDDARAVPLRESARRHRRGYVLGYRRTLGFVCAVLMREG